MLYYRVRICHDRYTHSTPKTENATPLPPPKKERKFCRLAWRNNPRCVLLLITYHMHHPIQSGCRRIGSRMDYDRNSIILIIRAFAVTLTLKIANKLFCMTLRLMMMFWNTKFGYKIIIGLSQTWSWQTFLNICHLPCGLGYWTQQSNIFIRHFGLWWWTLKIGLIAKGSAVQKTW